MIRPNLPRLAAWGALLALAGAAHAQSFYTQPVAVPVNDIGDADPAAPLREVSMLFVDVPPPRKFAVHDQVTILIDESSSAESKQTLDTKKDYDLSAAINQFPDLMQLLELRLQEGDRTGLSTLDLNSKQKFKGEGQAKRSDRFVARITAVVIDVKPNGTLVLEAKKSVTSGRESKLIVLSGTCRQADVTDSNTVTSSQLANLNVVQTTEGEVDATAKKGLIPRILETIFNF
ncbi:MAG: flagellar basal body L-ring protein FlgH [Phycisphaerales bacterium]|nr:flagellar basal body L-ring protein FlgH [Phycisphaerales bacterium]